LLKESRRPPVLLLHVGRESLTSEAHADAWLQECRCVVRASGARFVLIDCGEVNTVFASGLGKLLRIYRDIHVSDGQLALFRVPDTLKEILEITRMDRVLKLYTDQETA
jgi:anti-anti-sigma factor